MPEMVIDEIINSSKIVNVKSHKKVLEYNEVSENAYVILSGGFVSVMKNKATNEEVAVNFFIPDYQPYMTSYDSFNYSIPSNCALKSFTNSNILIIPKSKVFEIKDKSEEFMKLYYQISIDGLLERNRIRTYFQNMTSEERFTHLQQEYPQVIREVPSKYIADYIGISPQWLSKLKRVKL
jgi:hypothetical protein